MDKNSAKKVVYVLDTNVFLIDPKAIYSFGKNSEIVLPITVLEEIDKFKSYDGTAGLNARKTARELNRVIRNGAANSPRGIPLQNGARLKIRTTFDATKLPKTLDKSKNDNKILLAALVLSRAKTNKVVLVTNDITMTLKAKALGVETREHSSPEELAGNGSLDEQGIYKGLTTLEVDDSVVDAINSDKPTTINNDKLHANEFMVLKSSANASKSAMVRYMGQSKPLRKIFTSKQVSFYGVTPRNKEQRLYIDLLCDQNIEMITATGIAGSGKTLLAVASGMHQVLEKQVYNKLVLFRPVIPFGEDIGFLPGEKDEKMHEWLSPIWDNLHQILSSSSNKKGSSCNKKTSEMVKDLIFQGYLEIGALTYIKGRSFDNAFIVVDEAEDLDVEAIKMIATRVGKNSKVVFTGDITQIDNPKITIYDCGLAKAIAAFVDEPSVGHIMLPTSERSSLAGMVARIL